MLFKKTFEKVHTVVEQGSQNIQALVKKAEGFVDQTEVMIKSSENSIKIIAGFIMVSMGMQILVSYTQLRVNVKMLTMLKGVKK